METVRLPQKRYYRQRAHSNPIADHCIDYPLTPFDMDWSPYYPKFFQKQNNGNEECSSDQKSQVEFADIGCGYGGLLVELSSLYPEVLMLGMEIRVKVSDYVQDRIKALRAQNPGKYENIACIRSNAMKYLPNFFHKGQKFEILMVECEGHEVSIGSNGMVVYPQGLKKMFFLFPDPHFKSKKHKWRIINSQLLSEYAYVLQVWGIVYTITDVKDLHEWMVKHLDGHELFERIPDDELTSDPVILKLYESSEEGKKVTRNNGDKYLAVYRRIDDPFLSKTENTTS